MKPTIRPTAKQQIAWNHLLNQKTRYIVFGGGAGGGKSWLGCEWLITHSYFYEGAKWFIGRKELKRLMASSYVTFNKVCKFHGIPPDDWRLDGKYNFIEFSNGSRIDLLDVAYQPSDPMYERFGSTEYTGGWIEEAGEVHELAFEVLKSRMGRHMNKEFSYPPKMLLTCNPTKNWLYRSFYKPFKDKSLPNDIAFIQSLYDDNPYTAKEYGEQLKSLKDQSMKQRLMFGNWEYDDDPNTLIEYDAITDLFSNTVDDGEGFITADIARYGQDSTIIYRWLGWRLVQIEEYQKQAIDITSGRIDALAKEHRIPRSHIVVDEDGVGGGVVDILRGIKGFVANSSALESLHTREKENYRNLKAQCSYILADKVNKREVAINCEDVIIQQKITDDLEQIKSKNVDKDQPMQIISKEDVKEAIGRSPDFGDALVLRSYFELKPVSPAQRKPFKQDPYL